MIRSGGKRILWAGLRKPKHVQRTDPRSRTARYNKTRYVLKKDDHGRSLGNIDTWLGAKTIALRIARSDKYDVSIYEMDTDYPGSEEKIMTYFPDGTYEIFSDKKRKPTPGRRQKNGRI